jgi:hypothetical protein
MVMLGLLRLSKGLHRLFRLHRGYQGIAKVRLGLLMVYIRTT